ncbi:hypothetical protein tb265_47790 [Gemmatimonadetes bacterium T265]|nr:hypothetical protein tb265_47790 [Gemmatimonadetes bacterium T265]
MTSVSDAPGDARLAPPSEPEPSPERRRFLARVSTALGGLAAAAVAVPAVGFLLAPLVGRPTRAWRVVGRVDDFAVGATVRVAFDDPAPLAWSGATGRSAAWLRRTGPAEFTAFAVECTHLGCPVRWVAGAKLFMCPCHGGVYSEDGAVAAGPPPRALTRYPVRVEGGRVLLDAGPLPITRA